MIISFTNVIGAIRSLGEAAQVITTNLKMWLGFETSVANQDKVVNGDFSDGTTGWSIEDGWNVTNNRLNVDTDDGNLFAKQFSILEVGKTYVLTLDVSLDVGEIKFESGGAPNFIITTSDTTISHTFVATVADVILRRNVVTTRGYISNVSVRELNQITPDKSGNNNVGELFTGKALDFDGAGDYLDISGFSMSGNNATFAFWAYIRDNARADYFFDFQSSTTRFLLGFGQASQELAVYSGGWQDFGNPPQDQWVRIVLTVKGTTAKCFVDCVQLGTDKTISTYDFSSATTAHIGARYTPETFPKWYDGILSDFQVYDKVWLNDDIAYDYANPNKLAIDNPSTSLVVTNLKAYWAMSEGDGLVAYDSGTNLEEEEVTNGDFADGFDDWSNGSDWSVANNVATLALSDNATNSTLTSSATLVSSKTYVLTYTISNYTSGELALVLGNISIPSTEGDKTFTFTGQTELSVKRKGGATALSITNISVREVTASDHGGILNGATYVDAQPRIPQLGMMNWSKGSNLVENSNEGTYGNSPASEILTTNPFGGNTAVRPVPDAEADRYQQTLLAADISTGNTYTYSWFSKQISTPLENFTGNLKINTLVNCTVVSGSQEQIATDIGGFDRFKVSFTIDDGSSNAIFRAYFGNVIGIGNSSVAYWGHQLNEGSSADSFVLTDGGAALNSTVIPNPTIPTQDIFGNAVRDRLNSFNLDGSGYAEVADADDLDFGTGAFTMESWVKADFLFQGSSINVALNLGGDTAGAGTAGIVSFSSNKLGGYVNAAVLEADSTFTQGNWYHVAITRNISGLCTLYIDSVAQTDTENAGGSVTNSNTKQIGRDTNLTRFYQNLISDVRLYDAELSSDEVENNYNAGLSAHTNN